MSNSSQRTRSSSRHLNVASEARTSPRRQGRSSSSSLPFNLPRETRSSTRCQTNSCTNLETRSFTRRQLLARERRSRRAQIVRENRAARNIAHSDVNLVQAVSYEEYFRQIFGLSGSKKIVENIPRKYYLGNMGSVLRFRNIFFCF